MSLWFQYKTIYACDECRKTVHGREMCVAPRRFQMPDSLAGLPEGWVYEVLDTGNPRLAFVEVFCSKACHVARNERRDARVAEQLAAAG